MSEAPIIEKEERPSQRNLTPFEWCLLGGPESVTLGDQEIFVSNENLKDLLQDPEKRKAALSPLNVVKGEATLEQAREARKKMKGLSSMVSVLFDEDHWFKYKNQGIKIGFDAEDLDKEGQLAEIKVYPMLRDRRLSSLLIASEDRVLEKGLSYVLSFVKEEDGALVYKIKSAEEIKAETAPKA